MRVALYAVALASASLWNAEVLRGALATTASVLIEATPFVLAAAILQALAPPMRSLIAYLGCGCTHGPSARSLPAAVATWLVFGPAVALARVGAATFVWAFLRRRGKQCEASHDDVQPLQEIAALLPVALAAAAMTVGFASWGGVKIGGAAAAAVGAVLGFTSPCALGAVALAASLRAHAPAAVTAFLCIAGIVDARALLPRRTAVAARHDALAYALVGCTLCAVAARRGAALVHPALCVPLALSAAAAFGCSAIFRRRRCVGARIAPAIMLAGALIGAPQPTYHATETTLSDVFAGEELRFTGALECERTSCALVRYAITCCRADAAPVAVALRAAPRRLAGTWLRVDGTIERLDDGLALVPRRLEAIAPPADPFIYR
ncbi:MAG: hypothetical protein JO030_03395 [Candidatus Eremiobacteraeota bacterium]|nr:hypothetical protein [Candidatus Eremiobacteraeota bacterium]